MAVQMVRRTLLHGRRQMLQRQMLHRVLHVLLTALWVWSALRLVVVVLVVLVLLLSQRMLLQPLLWRLWHGQSRICLLQQRL